MRLRFACRLSAAGLRYHVIAGRSLLRREVHCFSYILIAADIIFFFFFFMRQRYYR